MGNRTKPSNDNARRDPVDAILEELVPMLRAALRRHFEAKAPRRRPVVTETPADRDAAAEVDELTRARARQVLDRAARKKAKR